MGRVRWRSNKATIDDTPYLTTFDKQDGYADPGLYLEPAPGEPGMNILKMAREGLRRDLTTALHKAVASRDPVRHPGLRIKTNDDFTTNSATGDLLTRLPALSAAWQR